MAGTMKDSEVEWIGEIPEGWDISKVKYIGRYINGYAFKPDQWGQDGLPIIRIQNLSGSSESINYFDGKISDDYLIDDGDILISWSATLDAFIWNYGKGWLNQHIFKAIPNVQKTHKSYFFHLMKIAMLNMSSDKHGSAMQHVTNQIFGNFQVPLPSLSEQKLIADFLDEKCAEIDKLSEDIQKQIDILNDYKKSVITRAVTKGLDPNAEMKDSGVEYIGEVPTKWNIHPIYYYFDERRHKNSGNKEQNLLSLSYGRIIRKDINTNGGLLPASFSTYNIVYKNDIIIRPTDLQNDKRSLRTGLVTERGIITSAYIDLRPLDGVNSEYYHYLLHAYDIMKVFYNMGNGVRQGLNYSEFSKLLVLEPSSEEQRTIVSYLNDKCEKINSIIATELDRLNELQSYKKSIIYEYVTGKKRVV